MQRTMSIQLELTSPDGDKVVQRPDKNGKPIPRTRAVSAPRPLPQLEATGPINSHKPHSHRTPKEQEIPGFPL